MADHGTAAATHGGGGGGHSTVKTYVQVAIVLAIITGLEVATLYIPGIPNPVLVISLLLMSAVNWGEVFYTEWRTRGEAQAWQAETALQEMPIAVIGVDRERATRAAAIKQKHGLGYADAFAAELAIERDAWLVTADPEFSKVGKTLSLYPLPRHEK